jgi:hypothetical protein
MFHRHRNGNDALYLGKLNSQPAKHEQNCVASFVRSSLVVGGLSIPGASKVCRRERLSAFQNAPVLVCAEPIFADCWCCGVVMNIKRMPSHLSLTVPRATSSVLFSRHFDLHHREIVANPGEYPESSAPIELQVCFHSGAFGATNCRRRTGNILRITPIEQQRRLSPTIHGSYVDIGSRPNGCSLTVSQIHQ